MTRTLPTELTFLSRLSAPTGRRKFLTWAGLTLSVAAIGCGGSGGDDSPDFPGDLGEGDTGILNYAYALEQLEAAFYIQAINAPYTRMSSAERQILTDIRDHEVIHRDFFRTALGEDGIPELQFDLSSINFSDRTAVLSAARTFEDLGVSAYNGAARLIKDPQYLVLAGKIVSVEARHAAAIRTLISPRSASFAGDDVVDRRTGLDQANAPGVVLPIADPLIVTPVSGARLPQS